MHISKHQQHNLSHAVQVAEKAVVHAIEQEVDTLFCRCSKNIPTIETQNVPDLAIRKARKTVHPTTVAFAQRSAAVRDYQSLEEFLEFTDE